MNVAAKISSDQEKAEAIQKIVRRYAETGDRSAARQLVPTIPSIPGQFRALVTIAELSDDAGDTMNLDAILDELERLCKEHNHQIIAFGAKSAY